MRQDLRPSETQLFLRRPGLKWSMRKIKGNLPLLHFHRFHKPDTEFQRLLFLWEKYINIVIIEKDLVQSGSNV